MYSINKTLNANYTEAFAQNFKQSKTSPRLGRCNKRRSRKSALSAQNLEITRLYHLVP